MGATDYGIEVPAYIRNFGQFTANLFRNSSYESDFDDWTDIWQQIHSIYAPTVTFETDRYIKIAFSTTVFHGLINPYYVIPILPGMGAEGIIKYIFDVAAVVTSGTLGVGLLIKPTSGFHAIGAIWFDFVTNKCYVLVDSAAGACYRDTSSSGTITLLWSSREITNYDPTKRNVIEFNIGTSKGTIEGLRIGLQINNVLVDQSNVLADSDLLLSDGLHPYIVGYGTNYLELYSMGLSR